jgi:hypothetical protein
MISTKSRFFRFLVGLDQALNPLIYGGSEDVTLSAQAAYREITMGKSIRTRKTLDWLFAKLGDHQHCYWSLFVELHNFPCERFLLKKKLAELGITRDGLTAHIAECQID